MKIIFSVLLCLFSIVSIVSAEVIDVNIKGIDDGIKTSRQQDYQEAVMNAKLQAIERAGASIESLTQVVNFQLKYDAVESKSKAILLPGFQIIDIGYVADGTYQVVLVGKIQTSEKETSARETANDGRFIEYGNGTVLDTRTWAARDNGSPVGKWITINDTTKKGMAIVEIYEKDGVINGKMLQMLQEQDGGKGKLCDKCTGTDKDKPIVGLVVIKGLKTDGNAYSGGTIMDPASGKTYKCMIEIVEGGEKLKVRGYIGTPMLGRNQFWLRAQ